MEKYVKGVKFKLKDYVTQLKLISFGYSVQDAMQIIYRKNNNNIFICSSHVSPSRNVFFEHNKNPNYYFDIDMIEPADPNKIHNHPLTSQFKI